MSERYRVEFGKHRNYVEDSQSGDVLDVNDVAKLLNDQQDGIERLRAERDEARDAARWFRVVLTNMAQGEQMVGVYERWPWLKEEVGDE